MACDRRTIGAVKRYSFHARLILFTYDSSESMDSKRFQGA
jgi:hypothetical protein